MRSRLCSMSFVNFLCACVVKTCLCRLFETCCGVVWLDGLCVLCVCVCLMC